MKKARLLLCSMILLMTGCTQPANLPQAQTGVPEDIGSEVVITETPISAAPEPTPLGSSPTPEPVPLRAANPLQLNLSLEPNSTVAQEIGPAGGTLSVSSADGTRYTLTVPEGALLSSLDISMTPVDSAEGIPFESGMLAGVHLTPEGLMLLRPARLEIQTALADDANLRAFSTAAQGNDFHLTLMEVGDDGVVRIPLMHFSTPGLVDASEREVRNIETSYVPSDNQNWALNELSRSLD